MANVRQFLIAEDIAAATVTKDDHRFALYLVVVFKAKPDPDLSQQTADKLEIGFLPLNDHFPSGIAATQPVKINVVTFKLPALLHQLSDQFRHCHIHVYGRAVIPVQQRQIMLQHTLVQGFIGR